MREEPQYQVFEYRCPKCGETYEEANSVKRHPDHRVCLKCGESGKALHEFHFDTENAIT